MTRASATRVLFGAESPAVPFGPAEIMCEMNFLARGLGVLRIDTLDMANQPEFEEFKKVFR